MLINRGVVTVGLLWFSLVPAWAQTAPDPFAILATRYNQIKAATFYAMNNCNRLHDPKKQDCKDFYEQSLHSLDDRIRAVDDWKTAVKQNNKSAVWEARIKLAKAEVVGREQAKEMWQRNFFGGKWNPTTIIPLKFDNYKNELSNAIYMRDNYCPTMHADAAACRKDWGQFVTDLQEVIKAGESSNRALQDGDKDRYYETWIEQQRLVVRELQSERAVKQKYMGQ
jgi:hypothetical protein